MVQAQTKTHRILLVDDHPIVREGLRGLLSKNSDIDVCGEANDTAETLALLKSLKPDALIVDISLGRESGLDLIREVRERDSRVAVLALSMLDEMIYARRALRSGANGYVMKQEATRLLLQALREVLAGRMFVSPAVTERLLTTLAKPGGSESRYSVDRLTDRELEIFRLIGMGVGSTEIASQLQISPKTVETHRTRIKDKLEVDTAAELVIQASGWLRDGRLEKPLKR